MKKTLALVTLCLFSTAQAELQALSNDELENERAISNITAFQDANTAIVLEPPSNLAADDDFRFQQELNALLINTPNDSSQLQSLQLENQILQGPNSSISVISNNPLNF